MGRSRDSSRAVSSSLGLANAAQTRHDWRPSPRRAFPRARLRSRRRATASALRASQARWKPPRPLMATMAPACSRRSVFGDRIAGDGRALRIEQPQSRPAHRAAGRLGVKAAVGGIAVFALAIRAERKRREAGLRPVVGQRARDRVARPAVGAGDEGMAPAAARRVEHLGETVGADGGVVADGRVRPGRRRSR